MYSCMLCTGSCHEQYSMLTWNAAETAYVPAKCQAKTQQPHGTLTIARTLMTQLVMQCPVGSGKAQLGRPGKVAQE